MSKILEKKDIEIAAECLSRGGLVAFATETVYGLAVIYDNKLSFDRLVRIKGRSPDKPFSMMVANPKDIHFYAKPNPNAEKLVAKFMPGEITLIMDGKSSLPWWVSLHTGKIGIRIPDDNYVRSLICTVGKPLLVTSANRSGQPALVTFDDVSKEFYNDVDAIVKGKCSSSMPSTVVDTCDKISIIRVGSISKEMVLHALEEQK
ncbi:MAG: L-threonylcarbamoyladenylate synthase [Bacilli bacterium]|jgi:L-threonylcarbamoyladenylate synthase